MERVTRTQITDYLDTKSVMEAFALDRGACGEANDAEEDVAAEAWDTPEAELVDLLFWAT